MDVLLPLPVQRVQYFLLLAFSVAPYNPGLARWVEMLVKLATVPALAAILTFYGVPPPGDIGYTLCPLHHGEKAKAFLLWKTTSFLLHVFVSNNVVPNTPDNSQQVFSRTTKGYVYALSPTPELWSHVVPSRTQIVQVYTEVAGFSDTYSRSVRPNNNIFNVDSPMRTIAVVVVLSGHAARRS